MRQHVTQIHANPLRQCLGKAQHVLRSDAIAEERATGSNDVATYRCPWCRFWHVGHQDSWAAKRTFYGLGRRQPKRSKRRKH